MHVDIKKKWGGQDTKTITLFLDVLLKTFSYTLWDCEL